MARHQSRVLIAMLLGAGCYTGLDAASEDDAAEESSARTDDGAEDGPSRTDDGGVDPPHDVGQVGHSGLRRLTANEYDNTIRDLLRGDEAHSELLLPADPFTPFDNAYATQVASQALVEGADLLAADAAERLLADPARRGLVLGCVPSGPADEACMRAFVERFARRALRRPVAQDEVEMFLHGPNGNDGALAYAIEANDFDTGVDSFLRTILQDPQFLYRVELGQPVDGEPGVFRLGPFEMATRLSYLLWGTGPDDALLDLAEAGGLDSPADLRAAAAEMLTSDRAIDRVDRFHAMWLGYEQMPFGGELALAMRRETRAAIERVLFTEDQPWQDLLTLDETWVDDVLAAHYGLPLPGSATPTWVPYDTGERRGLLAHGSFLSVGAKANDTSPVQRGLLVRRRLFCQEIPPPPPEVDVDAAPTGGVCKEERFAAHREGGCAGCHSQMDPVGFGLENFDQQGRYRTHESDNPSTPEDESTCEIAGQGEIVGVGTFHGPAELGALAIETGLLAECAAVHLYSYAIGRTELDELDHAFVTEVVGRLDSDEFRFDALVLELVGHEAFGYRREEP